MRRLHRRVRSAAAGLVVASALTVFAQDGSAQSLRAGALLDRTTYNELRPEDRLRGFGAAGFLGYERSNWGVDAEVSWRSLSGSDASGGGSVTFLGGGIRGRYRVWRTLSVEAGFESRSVDPEFATQDVALARLGLYYRTPLTSLADVWIRGAAIPFSTFSGGGEAGLGVGLGMGIRIGPASARWRAVAVYDFQRLDRTVRGVDVPIQMEGVRIGVEYAVF